MRLFTAIELGEDARGRAGRLIDELRRRAAAMAPDARITWIPPDRLHLTLRFIGQVDDAGAGRLLHALRQPAGLTPFVVRWGRPGAFPARGAPRVLWVGVERGTAELEALEAEVSARLASAGLPREERPYRPHLTLARVREAAGLRAAALFERSVPAPGETRVDAITLFESRLSPAGPAYIALQKTPLRAG